MNATGSGGDPRLDRAGYGFAAAAAAGTLFALAPPTDAVRVVKVPLPVVVVLLLVAVLGILGARTGRPLLFVVAAGIGLGASVLQLVQFGRSTNWLGGNGSTAAFLAALGIGFAALWYAARNSAPPAPRSGAEQEGAGQASP